MKRLLSLVLSLSLLLTMSTGFADKNEALFASKDVIENIALPEIIEEDEAKENKYVGRLTAMEQDLSTFVFANEDGTQTLRMFSHPVKFVDEEGKTKDITLDIAPAENGAFKTKDNSIITTFEKKLADGISLEYDDIDITMKPKLTSALSVASSNGKTVTYPYGRNTKIEYSLTYTGFKEDIVVEQYTGQTEYEFTLHTNGLKVEKIGEGYKVVDNEGNIKANIGDIIIFTADERNNTFGELTCETVKENEEYLLTIHIDADHLSDPKTVYPIRIDPTIEINYSGSGASAIEDVTINSTGGSDGSSGSLRVGKRETYGISRILMKFPALSAYASQSATVINASVEIRDIMCESDPLNIYCYQFMGNVWEESTATWGNTMRQIEKDDEYIDDPSNIGDLLSTSTVSYTNGLTMVNSHRYSFNITSALVNWKTSTYTYNRGLIFKASSYIENDNTYISKTFSSFERSSNQPSLTIVYNDTTTYSVNISTTQDIVEVGETKTFSCTTNPTVTPTWSSSNPEVATVNNAGVVTGISPGEVTIKAQYLNAYDTVKVYVLNSAGIEDGTDYEIMNYATGRYMVVDSASSSTPVNVYTTDTNFLSHVIWRTVRQDDGSFVIKPQPEYISRAIRVWSGNLECYTNEASSKFKIYRVAIEEKDEETDHRYYKEHYYIIMYQYYFVCEDSNNNVVLTTTLGENCLWSISQGISDEQATIDLITFNYVGAESTFDTTGDYESLYPLYYEYGCQRNHYTNVSATTAMSILTNENGIFIYSGHGYEGALRFRITNDELVGLIAVNDVVSGDKYYTGVDDVCFIEDIPENGLANKQLICYFGCSTGRSYVKNGAEYNLVDETFKKGAHCVIGTTLDITLSSHKWHRAFYEALSEGKSIEEAIKAADSEIPSVKVRDGYGEEYYSRFPLYIAGDIKQRYSHI